MADRRGGSVTSEAGAATEGGELVVSEVFGPTWQGEGPSLGTRAGFVRLGRCNLACTWCDTPYTWDWARYDPTLELVRRSVDDIARDVEAMRVPLVVITGGEPLIQQRHLVPLLERLRDGGHRIEIETAGTLAANARVVDLADRFNVSPKLANSGNAEELRLRAGALASFVESGKASFKFVVREVTELDEIAGIVATNAIPTADVWVMPEGTDATTLADRSRALADAVLARGWNMTTRLHVLLWGDERGR
ncbi:MAG TPA: 7-carboxy-7-deazaguanine synthase QueE [Acidimicrobiales bacterium]